MMMDPKKPGEKNWGRGSRPFAAVTAAAVLIAIVLIALCNVSIPRVTTMAPPPLATSPAVQPSSSNSPSQTALPSSTSIPNLVTSKGSSNAPVTIIEYSDFQ
jgi:hypothetical protein